MQHARFPYFININAAAERNTVYVTIRLLNLKVCSTDVHNALIISHALLYKKAQRKAEHFLYKCVLHY